jgi:hypothetical protein
MNCIVDGCERPIHIKKRQLCHVHYDNWRQGRLGLVKERPKHGMSRSSEYLSWVNMRKRCEDTNAKSYANYGGRGIRVCDEWKTSFIAFYKSMGDKPTPSHTLDRINNDGNYEPGNCRWATRFEQAHNQREKKTNKTTGYQNISFVKRINKFRVRVERFGRCHEVGKFLDLETAVKARDNFLLQYNHAK